VRAAGKNPQVTIIVLRVEPEAAEAKTWRRIAERALPAYGLTEARLRPLQGLKHRGVYRVDAMERGAPSRFVLRIHAPDDNRQDLRSVLDWLVALRRDTGLGVPEPVPTLDGKLLVDIADETGTPDARPSGRGTGTRCCEILRWLEGRVPGRAFSHGMIERLGAFTARLHDHALQFVPPRGFSRPTGEADSILRGEKRIAPHLRAVGPSALPEDDLRMLETAETSLRDEARHLLRTPSSFGLMHGDLHPRNLLFHRGEIRAIDFEGCAPDFFLYDLASSLVEGTAGWEILAPDATSFESGFASRREALLRGYTAVRPPPDGGTAQLFTFIAIRALSSLPWLATWAATRTDDGWTRMVLDARVRFLRAYLAGFR
jgi:Ser/Thr protein kinase RdoA (MazF antagonist)